VGDSNRIVCLTSALLLSACNKEWEGGETKAGGYMINSLGEEFDIGGGFMLTSPAGNETRNGNAESV
jgi:hypothetical protein